MRLAIVSDIHGNLLALDAVMTDIETQDVDQVWCGGDIGFGGPWASECIARVREAGWPTVKGNTDVWITGDPQTITGSDARQHLEQIAAEHDISSDDATWLTSLPLGHSGPGSILLVHATPQSPYDSPGPDSPAGDFAVYEGVAGLIVYGHVHRAFFRRLADGTLVANSGSVGMSKDGPMACYAVVDYAGADITIVHRRVAYDRRGALAQARVVGGAVGDFFIGNVGD